MKVFVCIFGLCIITVAYSQILRPGNPPEESGAPIYEEITVESVLTVRSKSPSRTGKSSVELSKLGRNSTESIDGTQVSRRTRSAEFRQEQSVEEVPRIFHLLSVFNTAHRIKRAADSKNQS